jgi:hypothetical protein
MAAISRQPLCWLKIVRPHEWQQNMKLAGTILVFVLICAISAWLFLASVPALVHRTTPELGQTLKILAGLPALAILWWFVSGRRWAIALLGWLILAVPFSAHALWQGATLIADRKGAILSRQMTVENFRETPIFWEGFNSPVGLEIELDLVHPPGLTGFVTAPQIRMAPDYDIAAENLDSSRTFSGGYFRDWHIEEKLGDLTVLKPVLFQSLYKDSPSDHDIDLLSSKGRTHLTYRLHPGTVTRLESKAKICLVNPSFGLPVCEPDQGISDGCVGENTRKVADVTYNIGTDLNALWTAGGTSFNNVDIGHVIAQALQKDSSLYGDSEAWTALQKQFEPAGLAAAVYRLCPTGKDSHSIGQVCYCRF